MKWFFIVPAAIIFLALTNAIVTGLYYRIVLKISGAEGLAAEVLKKVANGKRK